MWDKQQHPIQNLIEKEKRTALQSWELKGGPNRIETRLQYPNQTQPASRISRLRLLLPAAIVAIAFTVLGIRILHHTSRPAPLRERLIQIYQQLSEKKAAQLNRLQADAQKYFQEKERQPESTCYQEGAWRQGLHQLYRQLAEERDRSLRNPTKNQEV